MDMKLDSVFIKAYIDELHLGLTYIDHILLRDKIDIYTYIRSKNESCTDSSVLTAIDVPVFNKRVHIHTLGNTAEIKEITSNVSSNGFDRISGEVYCTYRYGEWIRSNPSKCEVALPVFAIEHIGDNSCEIDINSFYNDVSKTNMSVMLNKYIINGYLNLIKSIRLYAINGHTNTEIAKIFSVSAEFVKSAISGNLVEPDEAIKMVKNHFDYITGNKLNTPMYENYYEAFNSFSRAITDVSIDDGVYDTGLCKFSTLEKCRYDEYIQLKAKESGEDSCCTDTDDELVHSINNGINSVLSFKDLEVCRIYTSNNKLIELEALNICIKAGIEHKIKCGLCGNATVIKGYKDKKYIVNKDEKVYVVTLLVPLYQCINNACAEPLHEYSVEVSDIIDSENYKIMTLDEYYAVFKSIKHQTVIESEVVDADIGLETLNRKSDESTDDSLDADDTEAGDDNIEVKDVGIERLDDKTESYIGEDEFIDDKREGENMQSGEIVSVNGEEFEILGDEYAAMFDSMETPSEQCNKDVYDNNLHVQFENEEQAGNTEVEVCSIKAEDSGLEVNANGSVLEPEKEAKSEDAAETKETYWDTYTDIDQNVIDYVKKVVSGVLHFRKMKELGMPDVSIKKQIYSDVSDIVNCQYKNRYIEFSLEDEFGMRLRGHEGTAINLIDSGLSVVDTYNELMNYTCMITLVSFKHKIEKEAALRASIKYLGKKYSQCMSISGYRVSIDMDNIYRYEFESVCKPEYENDVVEDIEDIVEDDYDIKFVNDGDGTESVKEVDDTIMVIDADKVDIGPRQMSLDDIDINNEDGGDMGYSYDDTDIEIVESYNSDDTIDDAGYGIEESEDRVVDDDEDEEEAVVVFTNPVKAAKAIKDTALIDGRKKPETQLTEQFMSDYVYTLDKNLRYIKHSEDSECIHIFVLSRVKPPKYKEFNYNELLRVCNPVKMYDLPMNGKNVVITLVNNNMYYIGGDEDVKLRNGNRYIERRFDRNYTARLMQAVLEEGIASGKISDSSDISDITSQDADDYLMRNRYNENEVKVDKVPAWKIERHTEREIRDTISKVYGNAEVLYAIERLDDGSDKPKTHVWVSARKESETVRTCSKCGSEHIAYRDESESIITLPEIADEYEVYAEYSVSTCIDCGEVFEGIELKQPHLVQQQLYLNTLDAQKRKLQANIDEAYNALESVDSEAGLVGIVESLTVVKKCFEEHIRIIAMMVGMTSRVYTDRLGRLMNECNELVASVGSTTEGVIKDIHDRAKQLGLIYGEGELENSVTNNGSTSDIDLADINSMLDISRINKRKYKKIKLDLIKTLAKTIEKMDKQIVALRPYDGNIDDTLVSKIVPEIYAHVRAIELKDAGFPYNTIGGMLKVSDSTVSLYCKNKDQLYNNRNPKRTIYNYREIVDLFGKGMNPDDIAAYLGRKGYNKTTQDVYEILGYEKSWCLSLKDALEAVLDNLNSELN